MVSFVGKVDKMKIDQNEAWCSQVLNKFLIKCYQKLNSFHFQEPYACTHSYVLGFRYENPGKVSVHTEYLLYDFISTLGNVGGTLGLFVGFSFSGLISFLLSLMIKFVETFQGWIVRKENQTKIIDMQEKSTTGKGFWNF